MKATVMFPVYVDTDYIEGFGSMTPEEKREAILNLADTYLVQGGVKSIIHDCEDETLVD